MTLPEARRVTLEIAPARVYSDVSELAVAVDGVSVAAVPIRQGEAVAVPLELPAGRSVISLSLAAGNFRPSDTGEADTRLLSFAVRQLNLITEE